MTEPKKAGRPPKNGVAAQTDKRRAAEYRDRRRETAKNVSGNLMSTSTRQLVDSLWLRLRFLDSPKTTEVAMKNGARWVAGHIMAEICKRYKIEVKPI